MAQEHCCRLILDVACALCDGCALCFPIISKSTDHRRLGCGRRYGRSLDLVEHPYADAGKPSGKGGQCGGHRAVALDCRRLRRAPVGA